MIEHINDGGPAFPVPEVFDERRGETVQYASPGMTLRDYFAAKAMQGDIASMAYQLDPVDTDEIIAQRAYIIADAMLRAREDRND